MEYPVTHTFTLTFTTADDIPTAQLQDTLISILNDFGEGEYEDDDGTSLIGKIDINGIELFSAEEDQS